MSNNASAEAHNMKLAQTRDLLLKQIVRENKRQEARFARETKRYEARLGKALVALEKEKAKRADAAARVAEKKKKKKTLAKPRRQKTVRVPGFAAAIEAVFGGPTTKSERIAALAAISKRRERRMKHEKIPLLEEDVGAVQQQIAALSQATL